MRLFSPAFITVAVVAACAAIAPAQTVTPDEAKAIAEDAYIYGYSLITTEVTRVQMSNVPAIEAMRAPMDTFFNVKRYPPGDYRCVSAPNAEDARITPAGLLGQPQNQPPDLLRRLWSARLPSGILLGPPLVGVPNPPQEGLRTHARNQRLDSRPDRLGQADQPRTLLVCDPDGAVDLRTEHLVLGFQVLDLAAQVGLRRPGEDIE